MGVVYKLKPEVKDFILEQKRTNPNFSCRSLTSLIAEKFQIKLSKSSINAIIKETGLSSPVGRRRKKPKKIITLPKVEEKERLEREAAEKARLEEERGRAEQEASRQEEEERKRKEAEERIRLEEARRIEVEKKAKEEAEKRQKEEAPILLKAVDALIGGRLDNFETSSDIFQVIKTTFQETRGIKITLLDKTTFYIDGQFHTVWSTPYIPYDFSATIYNVKSYINKAIEGDNPLILFMAPGYDSPSKEFFNFILSFEGTTSKITDLTLYGNKLEDLEKISLKSEKKRFFILGLWPWQFIEYRKVIKLGEFKPFHFAPQSKDYYIADLEIALSEPIARQSLTLKGCALKANLAEKTRLIILSNLPEATIGDLANTYLSHWPNLEEAFQDLGHKIELFTYTGGSQRFFSLQPLDLHSVRPTDIKALFRKYLEALDWYLKWHFLPSGHENIDFPRMKERFYDLKAQIRDEKDWIVITFQPAPGYAFLKDLQYLCRRLNEREIRLFSGKQAWFSV